MNLDQVKAIIDQYARHDWRLRRALLSPEKKEMLVEFFESETPDVQVVARTNDALWFSRRSLPDREAWELRRLSDSPFALVTVIEDSLDDAAKESMLAATERRMFDGSHREPTSH